MMFDYTQEMRERIDELSKESTEQAIRLRLDPTTQHNGEWDAFRHAYSSGRIVQDYLLGESVARKIGFQHEQENSRSPYWDWRETIMDLHNNEFGRDIARLNPSFTPKELASHIYKRGIVENGLIQNLADPRIEEYKEYYLKQLDKNWLLSNKQSKQPQEKKQTRVQVVLCKEWLKVNVHKTIRLCRTIMVTCVGTFVCVGCNDNHGVEHTFNDRLRSANITQATVALPSLTDFEWSAVCLMPQYEELGDLEKKYSFLRADGSDIQFELKKKYRESIINGRAVLLFYDVNIDKYIPVNILNGETYNGMALYLDESLQRDKSANQLNSKTNKQDCLRATDKPVIQLSYPSYKKYENILPTVIMVRGG